jgi:hypothetical protein
VTAEPRHLLAYMSLGPGCPSAGAEGNGCAELFIRTLRETLLWVRRCNTIEELRQARHAFKATYNPTWIVERHGYQTPSRSERRSFRRSGRGIRLQTRRLTTVDCYKGHRPNRHECLTVSFALKETLLIRMRSRLPSGMFRCNI